MKRKIIRIIDEKCNGCGICVSSCPEGAIQIIDGKARLVNEIFCDGLGACIRKCPQQAIVIQERDAKPYDEIETLRNIIKHGENTVIAHLRHLKKHDMKKYYNQAVEWLKKNKININLKKLEDEDIEESFSSCPSSMTMDIKAKKDDLDIKISSKLENWPIQLHLISPYAPYFKNSNLVVAADCTAFAFGNFHNEILKGKKLIIACPKLDRDIDVYIDKLRTLVKESKPKSIDVITMIVPCCMGLVEIVNRSVSKTNIPIKNIIIDIEGNIVSNDVLR